jgi:phosphate transport system substrate-binding protein
MTQKNETAVLVLSLIVTAGILGGGYWWFSQRSQSDLGNNTPDEQKRSPTPNETISSSESLPPPSSPTAVATFSEPQTVPSGTTVRIDGSTSMVLINQELKKSFEQKFSGTTVTTNARGSDLGIQQLMAGSIDVAAISRPLTSQELEQGLVAIPIAKDAIAIVVGLNNPFRRGLKQEQIVGIFQGQITDWSAVGGQPGTIRVINRPTVSGTYQAFRELVLKGGNFGSTPNITSLPRDATTPMLRELKTDGIGYATYAQVDDQQTIRTVAIDGLTPESPNYPYQRTLYYVYKNPASPAVQAFLGYASSPTGQSAISVVSK